MNAGKITAKLRDAVPVHLFEDGDERGNYKNIELPDSIKALDIMDFGFNLEPASGKITFRLHFDLGILPEELPAPKPPVTREQKRAAKAARLEAEAPVIHTADLAAAAAEVIAAVGGELQPGHDTWSEPATEENAPENPGEPSDDIAAYLPATDESYLRFDVPGKKRSKLAQAIGEALACEVVYLNPPSYAYRIGALTLDREGILHGPATDILLPLLAERGFTPAE